MRLLTVGAIVALVSFAVVAFGWKALTPDQRAMHIGERISFIERVFFPGNVSEELADAPLCGASDQRVGCWLRLHRHEIMSAARQYKVDPRAIAGLIAYEALYNVHFSRLESLARWSGPGKIHYKEGRFTEGNPMAKQVEDGFYLPHRSMSEREVALKDPRWATLYIAAIMHSFVETVRPFTGIDISCDRGALVTLVTAWDTRRIIQHLSQGNHHHVPLMYNLAGNWVTARGDYVTEALGREYDPICASTEPSHA